MNKTANVHAVPNISTFFKFNAILLCVVNAFFTIVGIFLNCIVIMSLLNSQLRRKLCYFMILVLACFDLAVVVVFHPLLILKTISCWVFTKYDDSFSIAHLQHLFLFSLTALLTMTLERYLALVYPFFHEKFVTKSRLFGIFLLLQIPFAILYISLQINKSSYIHAIPLALIGIAFLVIFCLNYKIFFTARTIRNRAVITLGNLTESDQRNIETKKSKANLGKVSTCFLAVVCLFICYCPGLACLGIKMTEENLHSSEQTLRTIMILWAQTFVSLNSSLNCQLMFFYKNSALRRHRQQTLEKCFCAGLRFCKLS